MRSLALFPVPVLYLVECDHPRQPGTFGCFFRAHTCAAVQHNARTHSGPPQAQEPLSQCTVPTIEALCRSDAGRGPKDAEFRDRSASNVCPIATLRGLLL